MKRKTRWILAFAVLSTTATASAQPSEAENRTAAEAIFAQAADLMAQKDFGAACPKLEEVVKLQPNGIGARTTLADCYAGDGRLASAHAMYGQVASMAALAGQADRAASAHEKAAALAPRLSRLTISIPSSVAAMPGLEVKRDGAVVTPSLFNVAIAVDGGTHTIVASAPGRRPIAQTVETPREGATLSVKIGPFADDRTAANVPPQERTGASPVEEAFDATPKSPVRIGGIVVGALGVALAGAGIGLGVTGLTKTNDAADAYAASRSDGDAQIALEDHDAGRTQLTAGWAIAGIGGAALLAGVVMVIVAPSSDPNTGVTAGATLRLRSAGSGLVLSGEW